MILEVIFTVCIGTNIFEQHVLENPGAWEACKELEGEYAYEDAKFSARCTVGDYNPCEH